MFWLWPLTQVRNVMLVLTIARVWGSSDLKILYQRYLIYMMHAILALVGVNFCHKINLVKQSQNYSFHIMVIIDNISSAFMT